MYKYRHNAGDKEHYIVRGGDDLIVEGYKTESAAKRRIFLRNMAVKLEEKRLENWLRIRKLLDPTHSLYLEELKSGF